MIAHSQWALACGGSAPKTVALDNSPFFVREFTVSHDRFIFKDARGRDAWLTCNNQVPEIDFDERFFPLNPAYDQEAIARGERYRKQEDFDLYRSDVAQNQINGFFMNVAPDSPTQEGCSSRRNIVTNVTEPRCSTFLGQDQSGSDSDEVPQRTSVRFYNHSRSLSELQNVGVTNIPYPSSVMSFSSTDGQRQIMVVCNTRRSARETVVGPDYRPPPPVDNIQDEMTVIIVNGGREVSRVSAVDSITHRMRGAAAKSAAATLDMNSTTSREVVFAGCGRVSDTGNPSGSEQ